MELFNKYTDYRDFLEKIKEFVGYIEYEYLFEFAEPRFEEINYASLLDIQKTVSSNSSENALNNLLFNQRLSISMRSGDPNYNIYRAMFVIVLAVANSDTIEKLRDFNTFYTYIEDEEAFPFLREEGERRFLDPNKLSYGEGSVKFLDKNKDLIIHVSCHEKNYSIGDKYLYLFP